MRAVAILVAIGIADPALIEAQDKQHVVSREELTKDSLRPFETRQENEAAVRRLLSSEAGQKALTTARVEYARVDKAVAQLSDEDLANLAERSRHVENDFAAGRLSDRDLLILVIIAVLIIALVAALH
jgi:hypothetical protein